MAMAISPSSCPQSARGACKPQGPHSAQDFLNFASDFAPDQLSDSGKLASFQNGAPTTLCFPWKFPETQSAGDASVFLYVCRKSLCRPTCRQVCRLVLSPRWRRGPVPRLRALLWARGGSPSRFRTMGSVRIHPGVPPVALLRRNFAQALCRQSCARAPAARLRGGTGPWMLRCEAPAPGLQRGAISRLSRATSKLAPLSAAAAAAAGATAGADAAAAAARLSDSTRGGRRGHLTRRAASRAAAIAAGEDTMVTPTAQRARQQRRRRPHAASAALCTE